MNGESVLKQFDRFVQRRKAEYDAVSADRDQARRIACHAVGRVAMLEDALALVVRHLEPRVVDYGLVVPADSYRARMVAEEALRR